MERLFEFYGVAEEFGEGGVERRAEEMAATQVCVRSLVLLN